MAAIFNFFSATAERNSTELNIKKDLNVLLQICVFWVDLKTKMAVLASDFGLSSGTAAYHLMKIYRKQVLNAL